MHNDTIIALASAAGRGGVAVIRLSGDQVPEVISRWGMTLLPRMATYFRLPMGEDAYEESLLLYFPAPHSFTGEDVLEIHCHGAPVVVAHICQQLIAQGDVRLAHPGEFSERAFLNGKMDLTKAEAIMALIDATSIASARAAMRTLSGHFSAAIEPIDQQLFTLRLHIEAAIDCIDQPIDLLSTQHISTSLTSIRQAVDALIERAQRGRYFCEGIRLAILGPVNAGKSCLRNRLAANDHAIESDIPGTTRDALHDHFHMRGIPVELVDTAGIRETTHPVEQEGIRRSMKEAEQAHLVLWVCPYDDEQPVPESITAPVLRVYNKIDLCKDDNLLKNDHVMISAKKDLNIEQLIDTILHQLGLSAPGTDMHSMPEGDTAISADFMAKSRHLDALHQCQNTLTTAASLAIDEAHWVLLAQHLHEAQQSLGSIVGYHSSDDLLGGIFGEFCIGK